MQPTQAASHSSFRYGLFISWLPNTDSSTTQPINVQDIIQKEHEKSFRLKNKNRKADKQPQGMVPQVPRLTSNYTYLSQTGTPSTNRHAFATSPTIMITLPSE